MPTWADRVLSQDERDLIRSVGFDPEQVEPGSLFMMREAWERDADGPPSVSFAMRGSDGVRRTVHIKPIRDDAPLSPPW